MCVLNREILDLLDKKSISERALVELVLNSTRFSIMKFEKVSRSIQKFLVHKHVCIYIENEKKEM